MQYRLINQPDLKFIIKLIHPIINKRPVPNAARRKILNDRKSIGHAGTKINMPLRVRRSMIRVCQMQYDQAMEESNTRLFNLRNHKSIYCKQLNITIPSRFFGKQQLEQQLVIHKQLEDKFSYLVNEEWIESNTSYEALPELLEDIKVIK